MSEAIKVRTKSGGWDRLLPRGPGYTLDMLVEYSGALVILETEDAAVAHGHGGVPIAIYNADQWEFVMSVGTEQ